MTLSDLPRFIDRWTIEYVRVYRHPIERIWRAITDPKEFGQWFIRGEIDLKKGGAYKFLAGDFSGVVREIDPPHFIRFGNAVSSGAAGYFQYELETVTDGTRMRFVQHFPSTDIYTPTPDDLGGDIPVPGTPWKPGFVGGWHAHFDSLGDLLDDIPMGSRLPRTEFQTLAESWAKDGRYAGILDEKGAARLVLQFRRKERWNELNKVYRAYIREHCPPA